MKLDATNKPFLDSESSCNKPTARGGAASGIFRVPGTKFVFGFCPMTECSKVFGSSILLESITVAVS